SRVCVVFGMDENRVRAGVGQGHVQRARATVVERGYDLPARIVDVSRQLLTIPTIDGPNKGEAQFLPDGARVSIGVHFRGATNVVGDPLTARDGGAVAAAGSKRLNAYRVISHICV